MKNKIIINLHGTSSVGKSHLLHALYKPLKDLNLEVYTAVEAIKIDAYENRNIRDFEHVKVFADELIPQYRALHTEDVDIVISDSPITLSAFYFKKYYGIDIYYSAINYFKEKAENKGIIFLDYFIMPNKGFEQAGRFQTESESKQIQKEMLEFFRLFYGLKDKNILKGSDEDKISRILQNVKMIYETLDMPKKSLYNNDIQVLKA